MYEKIVEWLYLNDGKFGSARQWREEFLKYLKNVLEPNTKSDFTVSKCTGHFTKDLTESALGQGLKDLLDKKTADDLGTLYKMPGKEITLFRLVAINKNGNKYQDALSGKYIRLSKDMEKKLVKVNEFIF